MVEKRKGGRGMTGKGMDRSFMSPLPVPAGAALRLGASWPDEDSEVGVDNGNVRPSDPSPSSFFCSRPPSSSVPSKCRKLQFITMPIMDMDPSYCAGWKAGWNKNCI